MTDAPVITEITADGRATVTLNRPEVHNAFDDDLIRRLTMELGALDADASVRTVVLAGAGKSFSAGADLNWIRRAADFGPKENLADAQALGGLLKALNGLSKPTVAQVHGAAMGGGVGLVACCDVAIAATGARFQLSEVRLGLVPAMISPYVIAAVGERQARRYMVTGERFDAAEARRIGLVHVVTPADGLTDAVAAVVEALRANGPGAMAETKRLIAAVARRPTDDRVIAETAERIARARGSEEGREGVAAFLEKRKPGWAEG